MKCRFCDGRDLVKVLDLGRMPLAGGFLRKEDFRHEKKYPLRLYFCRDCTLVQVLEIPPEQHDLYKVTKFRSGSSSTVVRHFEQFATEVYARYGACKVLEIGANDGTFTKAMEKFGIRVVGVDPMVNEYFSMDLARRYRDSFGQFDVIVSSYTLSHIDDVQDVFRGIDHLLKDEGMLIFETYYLGSLLRELQYDMIYHEHCSYFSIGSLRPFLARYGIRMMEVKYIPEFRSGCMRYYCMKNPRAFPYAGDDHYDKVEVFQHYANMVKYNRDQLVSLLKTLKRQGARIIGYGATGRGTVIMNYCGIDGRLLDYVADDTPEKIGLYTPGTHVPIEAWRPGADFVLVFAWAFIDEIMKKHFEYIEHGGQFIVPLPEVRIMP